MKRLNLICTHVNGALQNIGQRVQKLNEAPRQFRHFCVNFNRRYQLPCLSFDGHALTLGLIPGAAIHRLKKARIKSRFVTTGDLRNQARLARLPAIVNRVSVAHSDRRNIGLRYALGYRFAVHPKQFSKARDRHQPKSFALVQ